jgi:hypothetical protein
MDKAQASITRREYKVMLDHRLFVDRKAAAAVFCRELRACTERLPGVRCEGEFDRCEKREIAFLDTSDESIRLNDLVFRQRRHLKHDRTQYTLKRRSADRIVAACAELKAADGLNAQHKHEEDIGAPFVVRFSASVTVDGPDKAPRSLRAAGESFPALLELRRDGVRCPKDLRLRPVRSITAFERVMTGPVIRFAKVQAEAAIIFWSDGPEGRSLVAEHSFRYRLNKGTGASLAAAEGAMRLFQEVQRLDWCLPDAATKTGYVYGE